MLPEIESMTRNTSATVLECNMMQPPQDIRKELELAQGDTALFLVQVGASASR